MVPGGLLERQGELARIDGLLAAAWAGRGGVLVINGPAGIGKTALVTEAGDRAGRAGMRVLAGRGGSWRAGFRSAWHGSFLSRWWLALRLRRRRRCSLARRGRD